MPKSKPITPFDKDGRIARAESVEGLRQLLKTVTSVVGGDTRFLAQSSLFTAEALIRVEAQLSIYTEILERVVAVQRDLEEGIRLLSIRSATKRPPTRYQTFIGQQMRAGFSMQEAASEWRKQKARGEVP